MWLYTRGDKHVCCILWQLVMRFYRIISYLRFVYIADRLRVKRGLCASHFNTHLYPIYCLSWHHISISSGNIAINLLIDISSIFFLYIYIYLWDTERQRERECVCMRVCVCVCVYVCVWHVFLYVVVSGLLGGKWNITGLLIIRSSGRTCNINMLQPISLTCSWLYDILVCIYKFIIWWLSG